MGSLLRVRVLLRVAFWGLLSAAAVAAARRSNDIAGASAVVRENVVDFLNRRVAVPTVSIINDVILNKRVSVTDKAALTDAKRSLTAMLRCVMGAGGCV